MASEGLDVARLRALRRPGKDERALLARIEQHLAEHEGYVSISGGKDSLVALHLALQVDENIPVCFFDSGLEFPETYAYLDQLADAWRLSLDVITPRYTALQLMAANGTWDHTAPLVDGLPSMFDVIVAEPASKAQERYGDGVIWGLRAKESKPRQIAFAKALKSPSCDHQPPCAGAQLRARHGGITKNSTTGRVSYSPVWDWTHDDVLAYIGRHQLPINPIYPKLEALGASEHMQRVSLMLDTTSLEQGRAVILQRGWPSEFNQLAAVLPRLREFC